jgi:hypothetical protein
MTECINYEEKFTNATVDYPSESWGWGYWCYQLQRYGNIHHENCMTVVKKLRKLRKRIAKELLKEAQNKKDEDK